MNGWSRALQACMGEEKEMRLDQDKKGSSKVKKAGSDYTLWQVRLPDENGELSEAFKSDFHEYGENAKKMRVLKGLAKLKSTFKETDKMSFFKSLEEAINITEVGLVREGKCFDRRPLTSWSDPNSAPVVLIGDAAHGMHSTPGQGARTAFEDAHQLNLLLDEVFNGPNQDITMGKALKSFHADSVGDPTLEVELEQGREAKKVSAVSDPECICVGSRSKGNMFLSVQMDCWLIQYDGKDRKQRLQVLESVVANLRTGDCVLQLQSKKLLKHNIALTNSYMTNLRGQHSLRLETTTPFKGSVNISSSFITNFQGTQELCVKGLHQIGERNVLTMSYITDLSEGNQVSMEAKHSVKGSMETALKVTNDLHGALQLCVSSSHIRDCNRWGLTYRNCHGEEHSVGLDWRHEVSPEKYFSVQASTQNWRWKLCADLHIALGMPPKLRTPCL